MIGAGAIQTPRGRPMAANVDKFPRSGQKPLRGAFIWLLEANAVHGVGNGLWRPTWTRVSTSTVKAAQSGVYSAPRGKCRPWGCERHLGVRCGRIPMSGTKPPEEAAIRSPSLGSGRPPLVLTNSGVCAPSPLTETACNTCNTYSVPYKGKDLKKRLSPKSLNTLIHQCITFYIFLIFQYLSLWKSVFSSN